MPNIFDEISKLDSRTQVKPAYFGGIVSFSSTRGTWFSISIEDLISVFIDIYKHVDEFEQAGREYSEDLWRAVFKAHLGSEVARDLSQSQTLSFFLLLSKIIWASNPIHEYKERQIDLDKEAITNTIGALRNAMDLTGKVRRVVSPDAVTGGENRLFYGAPGTGKSYLVDKLAKGNVVRTVFHPDTQNSDFIGSLKPILDDKSISYSFSPGPFAKALAYACSHPSEEATLIIEELNRAPAAAVFGELFLLLDRDQNGAGCYDADFPSDEFANWFAEIAGPASKMRLPANLWIFATMNSADQGVYPLDTAFRRRWSSTYVPIDYSKAPESQILIQSVSGSFSVRWADFVRCLNDLLVSKLQIEEDRLIGPRFLTEGDLGDNKLPGKLIIYLWDDLLRHGMRNSLFSEAVRNYGEIHASQENGRPIFSEDFIESLRSEEAKLVSVEGQLEEEEPAQK